MSLIVTEGIRVPTRFQVPETLAKAMPQLQIDITRFSQEDDAWCYAACASMVIQHCIPEGSVSQCDIAGFAKDTTCCPPQTDPKCTDSGCSKEQIAEIFSHFQIDNIPVGGHIDFSQVMEEISADPPRLIEVVVDWEDLPGTSHAVLIAGFREGSEDEEEEEEEEQEQEDEVFVIDPLSPPDFNGWHTHESVRRGFEFGRWDRTWISLIRQV